MRAAEATLRSQRLSCVATTARKSTPCIPISPMRLAAVHSNSPSASSISTLSHDANRVWNQGPQTLLRVWVADVLIDTRVAIRMGVWGARRWLTTRLSSFEESAAMPSTSFGSLMFVKGAESYSTAVDARTLWNDELRPTARAIGSSVLRSTGRRRN